MPIFRVKSVKIYTGQKNLHRYSRGFCDKYEVCSSYIINMNNASICENFYWHKPGTPLSGRILRVRVQMSVSRKWCLVTQCLQFGHFWDSFETFKSASDWVSEVLGDAMFAKLIKPSAVWVWDTGRWVPLSWKPNFIQPLLILYNCKKRKRLTRTRKLQEYCVSVVWNEWGQRRKGTIEDRKWLGGTDGGEERLHRDGKSKHTASTWGSRGRLAKIFMYFKLS